MQGRAVMSLNQNYSSTLRYLRSREINDSHRCQYESQIVSMKALVNRLGLDHELAGHTGCVNCLEWNWQGSVIASGSDDFHVRLWDPFKCKVLDDIDTGHQGNIFSVKFMPQSNDLLIATGAGDGKVKVHDITSRGASSTLLQCSCHAGRVKRLATAPDTPYLLWSGAEDGTVMQFDLRTPHNCSSGPFQILVNLLCHSGEHAEVKSISINPVRTEQLAVGANDPYVRLYDRRMIKVTSAQYRSERPGTFWGRHNFFADNCRNEEDRNAIPVDSAQYFTPAHLADYRRRFHPLASTYVTFDASGRYLLANMGGEQVYLYDTSTPNVPTTQITLKSTEKREFIPNGSNNPHITKLAPEVEHIKSLANASYQQRQFITAIGLYSKAMLMAPKSGVLYSNRAVAFMKRNWAGDTYAALRDCQNAIRLGADLSKPLLRMARCLQDLGWSVAASEALELHREKCPAQSIGPWFKNLERDIKTSLERQLHQKEQKKKLQDLEARRGTSSAQADETEEESDTSSDQRTAVLNQDTEDEDGWSVVLEGVRPQSVISRHGISSQESWWRSNAWDYDHRFCGHCNTTTDIKEANFFGNNGQYIVAGSDDGCIYIWERSTGIVERILRGDESIVNCLQPHPSTCLLATSGIDSVVRLWAPLPEGQTNDRVIQDTEAFAQANQRRMNADPLEVFLMNMAPGEGHLAEGQAHERRSQSGRTMRRPDQAQSGDTDEAVIPCRPS